MIRCPNCGQKTSGEFCQWCKYPLPKRRPVRFRRVQKRAELEARLAAKEDAQKKVEEERQAREARRQAEQQAKLAAKEEAQKKAEEAREVKQAEKGLEEIEKTCGQLRDGKIETEEAIQKLLDISDKIAK